MCTSVVGQGLVAEQGQVGELVVELVLHQDQNQRYDPVSSTVAPMA